VAVAAPAPGKLPDADLLAELHAEANRLCFIARSVNFPVLHEPSLEVRPAGG
jgi:organic hydroperoxide reductase OsmC/OhrA